jgi:transcriptional regulator with XRE-family HTH domain
MINQISNARSKSGLSQSEFAQALQISPRTLQEWEQGRRSPSGSARALINIALRHPEIIIESYEALIKKQTRAAQTLDEMTSLLLLGDEIAFSDLILDWYREGLECSSIPRPTDQDKIRLGVKASIVERLCEVLNSPPRNGDQAPAKWCKNIGPLEQPLKLQSDRLLEGESFCPPFEKRNIFVVSNFMFFI